MVTKNYFLFTQAKILSIVGEAIVLVLNKRWKTLQTALKKEKKERKTEEKKEKDRGEERERHKGKGKKKGARERL
mgnify:CR=1 FL=1